MKNYIKILYILSFLLWLIVIPTSLVTLFSSKTVIDLDLIFTTYSYESDWQFFSYISSLKELFNNGNYILAIVIIVFVFFGPLVKYISIVLRLYGKKVNSNMFLKLLSKAAMVDVYVITLILMISYKSANLEIRPQIGLYLLTLSVVFFLVGEFYDEREVSHNKMSEEQLADEF